MKPSEAPPSLMNIILGIAPYLPILMLSPVLANISPVMSLLPTLIAVIGAFALTFGSIPVIKRYTFDARLHGRDINKQTNLTDLLMSVFQKAWASFAV